MEGQEGIEVQLGEGGQPGGTGEEQPQGQPQGQQQVQDPNTGKMIPIERFNQVYPWMKELKEFGKTPAEIRQQLTTFREWQKAVEEHRKNQQMTPDEKTQAQTEAQIRKELIKIFPGLAKFDTLLEMVEKLESGHAESKLSATMEKASYVLADKLKEYKIDFQYQDEIEDYLASRMTEEELEDFKGGNFDVMLEKLKQSLEKGILAQFKKVPNLPKPPVRHGSGGTPPKGQPQKPKDLKEATDDAWNRFSSAE